MSFASRARIRLWFGALRRIPSAIAICQYPWNEVCRSEPQRGLDWEVTVGEHLLHYRADIDSVTACSNRSAILRRIEFNKPKMTRESTGENEKQEVI